MLFEQDEDEEQIEEFREFLDQVRPEDFAADERQLRAATIGREPVR